MNLQAANNEQGLKLLKTFIVVIVILIIINESVLWIKKYFGKNDKIFSSRLPYANRKFREIYFCKTNVKYRTTEDFITNLKESKGKTKLKFCQNIRNVYDEMKYGQQNKTFQFEEDSFAKIAQGVGKFFHEVSLKMNFLLMKP